MSVLESSAGPSTQEAAATLRALANVFLAARREGSRTPLPPPGEEERPHPPALLVVDSEGLVRTFDGQAERLWGLSAAEVISRPVNDLLVTEARSATEMMPAVARGRDGQDRAVLTSCHPFELAGERFSILVVQPAPALASHTRGRTELRYRNLVEQIPAVVFTAALDGGLYDIYVGPQIETLLGYTQQEWLRSPVLWYERLHPDDRRLLDLEFARGCATGGPFRAECRFIAADGRTVWVHGEARLIKDSRGYPLFLQGVAFDITEAKRAEELVRASLREKELLLKEIHHRVKNNLQITSSLLRLQVARVPEEGARQVLRESQDRIRSIALVHEMLYRSQDLSRVNFTDYVKALLQQLFRSYSVDTRRIARRLEVGPVDLGINAAVPCGLILNELVANALKHAFPEGRRGSILVRLSASEGVCRLVVRDDGIGFPPQIDFRQTETLGLQLVKTLADQLDGRVELNSDAGTEFVVTFPLPEVR
jgi:PAS domain S-box-containing protein